MKAPLWSRLADTVLDRSVVGGFSSLGYAARRRLPGWPADPPAGALDNTVAVVTGASSGIGVETAAALGRLGAEVHLVVRDVDKGERVATELRREIGSAAGFRVWRCDLSDLDDVRAFAETLAAELSTIDVLVHNAGALPAKRTESAQGHEVTMAVHVLGPVLLTELALGSLRRSERGARVVFVTSGGMYAQALRPDDPEFRDGDYSGTAAYARSKRAQVELLPVFARRWSPVDVVAMHPGWVDTPGVQSSIPTFRKVTRPILRDADGGADTITWLAATEPPPATGTLWHDRRERPTHLLPSTRTSPEDTERMWAWVRDATGLPATFLDTPE